MSNNKKIRPYTLCKFNPTNLSPKEIKLYEYDFKVGQVVLFVSEIANMPGHCVIVDIEDEKIYVNYHTSDFTELNEEEI